MEKTRLADRLNAARRRLFMGRVGELDQFSQALAAPELPFVVLHIFGPGGIGKSFLLAEFARICQDKAVPALLLDGRNIDATPEAFFAALRRALHLDEQEQPTEYIAAQNRRHVFLIDTYELLAPLDAWLNEVLLPQLPEDTLIVIAGRFPPSAAWRGDPGWQSLIRTVPLRNLSPVESLAYLTDRNIPSDAHTAIITFTHGHPLALSLVADMYAHHLDLSFTLAFDQDIIKTLLERLLDGMPDVNQRAALEIGALVRVTTEALLQEMLAIPDGHALFLWLRSLSFFAADHDGLYPHDLARAVLTADMRWRRPDRYQEIHTRARAYYIERFKQTRGHEQERLLRDYIYLHRDNPFLQPHLQTSTWGEAPAPMADSLRADDSERLIAMVAKHEGDASAAYARRWLAAFPQGVMVMRDTHQQPVGFLQILNLEAIDPALRTSDPATRAAWDYLQTHMPLHAGETGALIRFWMGEESYQAFSRVQGGIGIQIIRYYLVTPNLAFSFFPCREPSFWAPLMAYADLAYIAEADFSVGGHTYGVFGHNWRETPPLAWLARLAERETASISAATPPDMPLATVALSEPEFAGAVRDALRFFTRPEKLRANPLLHSAPVMERAGDLAGAAQVAALQALILESIDPWKASPRDVKLYRVIYHTFIQPAPSQEEAAALLDLPFSTYRRYLKSAIERIKELLWQREQ